MDETPNFDASNIHILVLDEADRILDMVHPPPPGLLTSLARENRCPHGIWFVSNAHEKMALLWPRLPIHSLELTEISLQRRQWLIASRS